MVLTAALSGCRPGAREGENLKAFRLMSFTGAEAPMLAEREGFFRKAGLAVEMQETPGAAKAMEALLAGSVDSIVGTYEQVLQAHAQGKPVVAYMLLTDCHCLALVAAPGKAITSVSDLKGKVIGVGAPGGQMQNFAGFLLQRVGLRSDDAAYVAIGVGANALTAIEAGKVDAGVVLANTYAPLRSRHPDLMVLAETFTPAGMAGVFDAPSYPSMALIARPEWLEANADAAQRMIVALHETISWMRKQTVETIQQKLGLANADALRMHLPRYLAWGEIPPERLAGVYNFVSQSNSTVAKARFDLNRTYTNRYFFQAMQK